MLLVLFQCDKSPTQPAEALYNLRITEIHYNPTDTAIWIDDSLEFIELKNIGSSPVDLGSMAFTSGLSYRFSVDALIEPGEFIVLASSRSAFAARYGFAPYDVYEGQLRNSGETIEFFDELTETVILSVTYGDSVSGWSPEADGEGYSLVPSQVNPAENSSNPTMWRRSVHKNGSPGEDDIKFPVDEALYNLRLTEIHYHPADPDTFNGDNLEFIEIKNVGSNQISLGRAAFTSGIAYTFSETASIDVGEFIVLASNKPEFQRQYDTPPFDVYSGQLSNSGENIRLEDMLSGESIIFVSYMDGAPWPGSADGEGFSLVPYSMTPNRNQNDASAWRCSYRKNGSPGTDDPGIVVINEIVSNPLLNENDAIELYNPGDVSVDISGWFLTDRKADPIKYIFAEGTHIAPGEFLVLTDDDFSNSDQALDPFSLNMYGDDTYIMSDSSGCLGEGYCHGTMFGMLEQGVSYGRYITTSGDETFAALSAVTLGAKNAMPRIGPIVISEIQYASLTGKSDFIEMTNIDYKEIRLYDQEHSENTWKIDELEFYFPTGVTIKPNESIVVVSDSISVDDFRTMHTVDDSIQVYNFNGTLDNSKEEFTLMKPETPYTDDNQDSVIVPYTVIDVVKYKADKPWPEFDDDSGTTEWSLHRTGSTVYGSDPASWNADEATPGVSSF